MDMQKQNYRSEFDAILRLRDCRGNEVGWPDFDWRARFYTGTSKVNAYTASCVGGVCENCYNDGDRIHVVFDNHRLSPGVLNVEFCADLPNSVYSDGSQRLVKPQPLGIELVTGAGACRCDEISLEVMLPFAVVSAYETAQKAGFAGTQDEYYAALSMLPALSASVSDLAAAKAEVAAALRMHGVDVADGASLHDMADAVAHLQLAVEGEPGIVSQEWRGVGIDLLNALRNHTLSYYPYSWAAATPESVVTLTGASAYLCSDGFFTTESGTEHHFADGGGLRWVIFYHPLPHYTVRNTLGVITEICVLSGTPNYELVDDATHITVGALRCYSTDSDDEPCIAVFKANGLTVLSIANLDQLSASSTIANRSTIYNLSMPALRDGGQFTVNNLQLHELRLPMLESGVGAVIANNCAKLEVIDLPKLIKAGQICYECRALKVINLPSLLHLTATYGNAPFRGVANCNIYLDSWRGEGTVNNSFVLNGSDNHLYTPSLDETAIGYLISNGTHNHLHLGHQQHKTIGIVGCSTAHLHVAPGFRSSITSANTYLGTTRDELLEIIDNLAANNDHDTHSLNFGSTLLALLTEDEIALATAKNYTLS